MEAYGSYEDLLASGVELMQLMKIKQKEEEDDRDLFSYNEENEEYEEDGNGEGEGEGAGGVEVRKESLGGVKDREMAPLVPTDISPTPHSPHMRNNVIYFEKGESNLSSLLKKPRGHYLGGEDLLQFPPDSASIYSAPSMLSLHSAVESSKHEEEKVKQTVLRHFVKGNKDCRVLFVGCFMCFPHRSSCTVLHLRRKATTESLWPPTTATSELAGGSYLVLTTVLLVFLLGEVKGCILKATTLCLLIGHHLATHFLCLSPFSIPPLIPPPPPSPPPPLHREVWCCQTGGYLTGICITPIVDILILCVHCGAVYRLVPGCTFFEYSDIVPVLSHSLYYISVSALSSQG